ncbi:BTB/POZ protein [Jimgerdemannia flammicorona]|uniref:BTB/POZ protein n=1 Tax=Jimgerdemannia flammicorona TaxID=994334 RepID=A0A433D257_9FUNG|nr:BTB/POZ protein [Jimgerdemannia flammicorona]
MNAKPLPIVFEWNIDNSTELEDRRYESSIFWTSDRHPWKLHFYPHGTNKAGIQDYFSLYVAAVHNDNAQHIWFARYDVNYTILFRSGNLNIQRTGTAHFEDDWVTRGWNKFAVRDQLLLARQGGKGITIVAEIRITGPNWGPNPLANAVLLSFFNKAEYGDVVFHFGGREIYAHKDFLSARNDYFAALFRSGMEETRHSDCGKMVVNVTDTGYGAFFAMLKYLYSGYFDFYDCSEFTVEDLFRTSDKYNVEGLRAAMEDCIVENLKIDDVVQTLFGWAYLYPTLRKECVEFIGDNYEHIVRGKTIGQIRWDNTNFMEYSVLMKELLEVAPIGRKGIMEED